MKQYQVLVTDYVFESFECEQALLQQVNASLVVRQCHSIAELLPEVAEADVLLNTYLPGIDARVFERAPKLKAVVRYGIGLDTIDVSEATRRGILVANVPDYCVEEVADHAVAHFLCLARKMLLSDRKVKSGQWSLAYVKPLRGISDMILGIIGMGRIGRAIAARLRAFGPAVVFHDPCVAADGTGCRSVSLDELWAVADAIFVQCPATAATHHLLNREAFERMKKRPFIINCARGSIVDTEALVWALETGRVSGAGLDVLEDEKIISLESHPLKQHEQVILTPHSAWYSSAAIKKLQRKAAEEAVRVLRGQPPAFPVNPEVLNQASGARNP